MQLRITYSKHWSVSRRRDALAIFIFRDENVSLNRHSRLTSSKDYDALWFTGQTWIVLFIDTHPWPTSTSLQDTRDFHFCDLGIIPSRAAKVKAKCEFQNTGVRRFSHSWPWNDPHRTFKVKAQLVMLHCIDILLDFINCTMVNIGANARTLHAIFTFETVK